MNENPRPSQLQKTKKTTLRILFIHCTILKAQDRLRARTTRTTRTNIASTNNACCPHDCLTPNLALTGGRAINTTHSMPCTPAHLHPPRNRLHKRSTTVDYSCALQQQQQQQPHQSISITTHPRLLPARWTVQYTGSCCSRPRWYRLIYKQNRALLWR